MNTYILAIGCIVAIAAGVAADLGLTWTAIASAVVATILLACISKSDYQ